MWRTLGDGRQKRQGSTLDAQKRVARVKGLEQVTHVADVDPGLSDRIRLLNDLQKVNAEKRKQTKQDHKQVTFFFN